MIMLKVNYIILSLYYIQISYYYDILLYVLSSTFITLYYPDTYSDNIL